MRENFRVEIAPAAAERHVEQKASPLLLLHRRTMFGHVYSPYRLFACLDVYVDDAVNAALGLDGETVAEIRRQLAAEPSVTGERYGG